MAEFMAARVINFNYFSFPEFSLFVGEQNTEQSALHNEGITTTAAGRCFDNSFWIEGFCCAIWGLSIAPRNGRKNSRESIGSVNFPRRLID